MSDNELILAISNLLEPIRDDIQEIKGKMTTLEKRMGNLESRMDRLESRVSSLENRMDSLENRMGNLESQVKGIELTQENEVLPRLQNIENCYTSTYDRYKDSVDNYETMRRDVSILKKVVTEHSEKLQKIV